MILTAPGFAFSVIVDGDDLVVRNVRATCFGGGADPQDDGETASGISTKANSDFEACALPMNYAGSHAPTLHALGGSPIPRLPWRTIVEVTAGVITIEIPVIDLGPAKQTGNGIDLTIAAARRFKRTASATNFEMHVDYRIRGGARFLPQMPDSSHAHIIPATSPTLA